MQSRAKNAQKWGTKHCPTAAIALISMHFQHCTRRGTNGIAICIPEYIPVSQKSPSLLILQPIAADYPSQRPDCVSSHCHKHPISTQRSKSGHFPRPQVTGAQ